MTTLLALYRRPEGGDEALSEFERRYATEHLPLVAQTPGLRGTRVQRVSQALGTETDLVLVTAMDFDDRASLDAGLASDAMRAGGRNLREIAPGLATLLVLEEADDLAAASAGVDTDATPEEPVTDEPVDTDAPTPTATTHMHSSAHVRVELPAQGRAGVALVTIVRPEVLNALSFEIVGEIADAFEALDGHPDCRAIVLTGEGDRAFAAGADIKELAVQNPTDLAREDPFTHWDRIRRIRKPIVAAVRGFALGGGCELAMACDVIVAGDDAKFGQPEIRLGVMPGAGGTQRLTRAIGKARAMDLILTGRTIDAREAEAAGLVSRVVAAPETLTQALDVAAVIASMPPIATLAAKRSILRADELPLEAGLQFERRDFYLLFASEDQREGMAAFSEKRTPTWKGR